MSFITIIGLGTTGYSCVEYCVNKKIPVKVIDTRKKPPNYEKVKENFPDIPIHIGNMYQPWILQASKLIISPGVSLATPEIKLAIDKDIGITNDIQIFLDEIQLNSPLKPLIAITGSNGKSTVVKLVENIIRSAGLSPAVGGNIGIPALSLLDQPNTDVYVLELSSFQLELINYLPATSATVLNISADHLDRHANIIEYAKIKSKIYTHTQAAIYNAADKLTTPQTINKNTKLKSFSLKKPEKNQYGIVENGTNKYFASQKQQYADVADLKIYGSHNYLNVLAAIALCKEVGITKTAINKGIVSFSGLEHRCQWIGYFNKINWFNDSKATNVGATISCLEGLPATNGITLIAGGDGKNADFSLLSTIVSKRVNNLIVYGQDARLIASVLGNCCSTYQVNDLTTAVKKGLEVTQQQSTVVLSPACSSLDMFDNFEHRGKTFINLVNQIVANGK